MEVRFEYLSLLVVSAWAAARRPIQAPSVQRQGVPDGTMEPVAGATSACQATGSAFCGSGSPAGPRRSYL